MEDKTYLPNDSYTGKLIVISGTDGSGKGTQLELLNKRLLEEGHNVKTADFPRYSEKSAGAVEDYLNGNYGTAEEVGPYRASVFYAVDRFAASFETKPEGNLHKWLQEGNIVLSNRYVSANKGHQMGKIKDQEKREKFLSWLDDFEYGIMGIPKENVNIFLYVPPEIGQQLVDKKEQRSYTTKKRDIHEADLNHLKDAAEAYMYVAKKEGWEIINCTKDNELMTIKEIHELIYQTVLKIIKK